MRKLDWMDLALMKLGCVTFGVLLATLIPELTGFNPIWLVALFLVLELRPFYRGYIKKH